MTEIQIIRLVFGILLGLATLVLAVLTYFLGYKKWYIVEEHCSLKVSGTVISYTLGSRAKHAPLHLPVVEYMVDGKKYKVVGPKYKVVVEKSRSSLLGKNEIKEIDPYSPVLHLDSASNAFMSIHANPMEMLFPKGSKMNVFYNPGNPKEAYALRYVSEKFKFYILLITTILMFIGWILILVLL
ncbi:MAG: hypothetical protein KBT48_00830 [Firmicutes bacterium]|nr:hypothetical protein [Bacillota bacterium]